ncbi:hypothetical protein [Parathalassolituus penaei]|uniref:Uncharacterized protein n=1 Tax=Parathalassolituus penaei TaxID=2997323 RepID=A0A9X3EAN3_9GAMM|nr:hypothetical protein [Parathalassolituus penaei]MCY0964052.1 hypothetical protein [Parathalassolituus penaei]
MNDDQKQPRSTAPITLSARLVCLLITVVTMALGIWTIIDEYAPGRATRFGQTEAITGPDTAGFGMILMLLGCMPLLVFCRNAQQVAWLGSALGVALLAVIFTTIYL